MKRCITLIFGFFAVAIAGCLLVAGLTPSRHTASSDVSRLSVSRIARVPGVGTHDELLDASGKAGEIQSRRPCSESAGRPSPSNPASVTTRTAEANGFSVQPAKQSPSGRPARSFPAVVCEFDEVPEDQAVTAPVAPQAAVWVDLGPASTLPQEQQDEIQSLAESLSRRITESGFDPASPEYKQLWDEAVVDSDQQFRQRYGNQAWMEHHAHAHHLGNSAVNQDP